jgi:hypothetical protein
MLDDYAEQIALNGTRLGRPESPGLEGAASKAVENAFRELIEDRYFYQKVTVDLTDMDAAIKKSVQQTEIELSQSGPGPGPVRYPTPATPKRLQEFRSEVGARPWRLATRNLGDNPRTAEISSYARAGAQPLGTDAKDLNLHFYLPAVRLQCASCKGRMTFTALPSSDDSEFCSPYPRKLPAGTEQIFTAVYRCEMCREAIYTILIRRIRLRLHLCGFAPRREPLPFKSVPEQLLPILNDAEQAVAEGDLYAGFYHLRTMLEHYLKTKLGMPITQQIRGDDLVENYYKALETGIKGMLPSLATACEKLSVWLHTRTGEAEDYQKQRDAICKHIEVIAALGPEAFVKRRSRRTGPRRPPRR